MSAWTEREPMVIYMKIFARSAETQETTGSMVPISYRLTIHTTIQNIQIVDDLKQRLIPVWKICG